jgi:hypothetical protein
MFCQRVMILGVFCVASLAAANAGATVLQHTTGQLSVARSYMSAAATGDQAVFAGGCLSPYYPGSPCTDGVDIFDTSSDQWTTAHLSKARAGMAVTTVGSKVIFAGGYDYSLGSSQKVPQDTVDIYDESTGSWTTAKLSAARYDIAAVTVGDLAIFAGGNSYYHRNAVADIYNGRTGQWSTAPLSQARSALISATVGHTVLFAGGDYNAYARTVDVFDVDAGTWSTSTLPTSALRLRMAAASTGTRALFAGGNVVASYSNAVDIYDGATKTWSTATLSQPRAGITAAAANHQAIFASGWNGAANVDIYNGDTGQWSSTQLSTVRVYPSATVVGDTALFAGGEHADQPSAAVDIYCASTNQWSTDSLSLGRDSLSAITVGSAAIFAGGESRTGDFSTAVDIFTVPEPGSLALLLAGAVGLLAYAWRRRRG